MDCGAGGGQHFSACRQARLYLPQAVFCMLASVAPREMVIFIDVQKYVKDALEAHFRSWQVLSKASLRQVYHLPPLAISQAVVQRLRR